MKFQFKKPVLSVYKSVIPFIILMFGTLLIITYVPALSTALPHSYIETTFPSLQEYIDSDQLSYEEEQELSDEEFIRRARGESGEDTEGDLNPDTWSEGDDGDLMPDSPGLEDESGDLMPDDPSIEDESGDLMPDEPSIEDESGDLVPDNPSFEDESGDLIPD